MIFRHTHKEFGMWRGWLRNDQSLEITWATSWKRGWCDVGARVLIHSNDSDKGDRMLNLAVGFAQVFIPLGVIDRDYTRGDEPSWGVNLSGEAGIVLHLGKRRRYYQWPFRRVQLDWDYETRDGWATLHGPYVAREDRHAKHQTHPYTYTLKSGEVQRVEATISRRRRIMSRHILHRLGWPKRTSYEIDIEFSGEVGERAGSWKGGCIGCAYTMLPGESPLDTLRRMERERTF